MTEREQKLAELSEIVGKEIKDRGQQLIDIEYAINTAKEYRNEHADETDSG